MNNTVTTDRPLLQHRLLLPIAVFVHSLFYVLLVGQWAHYDEPGHMLYVLQILEGGISTTAATPAQINEVADAVLRSDFWQRYDAPPSLFDQPINAIVPTIQTHHPPLYYALNALVLLPLRGLPIELLLIVGRFFSALLLTLLVLVLRTILRDSLPEHPQAATVAAIVTVLNPAFSDLMTALNSDVLLNLAAAVTFLGMLRLVRDGLQPAALVMALGGMLAVLLTKRTGLPLLLPLACALGWAVVRRPIRWWWYLALPLVVSLIAAFAMFDLNNGRLVIRGWLIPLQEAYLRVNPARVLNSLIDVERTGEYNLMTLRTGWDQFFVRLGWGEDRFAGTWLDLLVQGTMLIGLGAAVVPQLHAQDRAGWRERWHGLMLISLVVAQAALILRVHPVTPGEKPWIPSGRYLFWAMTAVVWLVTVGWLHLTEPRRLRLLRAFPLIVLVIADGAALLYLVST